MFKRATRLAALVVAIAAAGCAGSDGAQGPQGAAGADGTNGTNGTNGVNGVTGKLSLAIDGVVTANNTATLTFTIRPAAAVCPGGTCDANLASLGQKTFYAQKYNAANNTFDTGAANNFSFGGFQFKGFTADGNGAQYTATKANAGFAVETAASAYVYGYVSTQGAVPVPSTGHYMLPSSVASAAKVYGTAPAYSSTANVAGCEKCHGAPFSKHGYRQAAVAGLPDFASCKVCHTDQRVGSDQAWYAIADDPAQLAADPTLANTAFKARYAYTANIMNDVHNSHAFEFNYPQKMSNCVTCHAGKLDRILTDANFRPAVCKSCHPAQALAGVENGRAPALHTLWANSGTLTTHAAFDPIYGITAADACNGCHKSGGFAPTFATLHKGYNVQIYTDGNGTRYSDSIKTTISSIAYDAASYATTVSFSVSGISTTAAVVTWSAYAGVYGFDSKDFVARPSITVTQQADKSKFVGKVNLSGYASQIAAGQVKRVEIALMPVIGMDPTVAVSTTSNPPNLAVAALGAVQTLDVQPGTTSRLIAAADSYGKKIVDTAKCNVCHDALGTSTFHSPRNGSATTVACRICHQPTSGAGFYEMQSRSFDSFIHAAHSMQMGEMSTLDLTNPVEKLRYNDHVEGNFPNFAGPLNCEACHYPGAYDVPDQARSLPGLVSALQAPAGGTRTLGAFAAEITGPSARACGGCHRAQAINEQDGVKLAAFVAHTNDFSSMVDPTASLTTTAAYIQSLIGNGPAAPAVAGAQVERCTICHATSGSQHQKLFNVWKNGL